MKSLAQLSLLALSLIVFPASEAFAQLSDKYPNRTDYRAETDHFSLNPATSGAGLTHIWILDTGVGLAAGPGWDWDEDFMNDWPNQPDAVISAATEFLRMSLPDHSPWP